jgi:hypothetical protein
MEREAVPNSRGSMHTSVTRQGRLTRKVEATAGPIADAKTGDTVEERRVVAS